jgi:hypothetical protein
MNRNFSVVVAYLLLPVSAWISAAHGQTDTADTERVEYAQLQDEAKPKGSRKALSEEDTLAQAALESLLSVPPERALPVVKKVLAGGQSLQIKSRALFVLSQMNSADANTLLVDHAKTAGPLRLEAIRNIGIGGNKTSLAALSSIYAGGDAPSKKAVLQAWMIAGSKEDIYQAATNASNDADLAAATKMLGVMGAKDELRKLGEVRKPTPGTVEAYAIAGDIDSLKRLASANGDLALRTSATRSIGIVGNAAAKTALREIYSGSADAQIKDAALQGMLIANDQQGVLTLYRNAKSTEDKRSLLRMLTLMGGDVALQAIDAALDGKR